ncbi:MAG: hypothetical protein H6Q86_3771 [candidate division NC10 bacterium]|nr:hypothetical protein [candidate division NC10 bacterium]
MLAWPAAACRRLVILLASACLLAGGSSAVIAADKTYLHVTLKAFLDAHDSSAAEWAWVTMVEVPKSKAFPDEARLISDLGGELAGTALGLVRAAAWRSSHRYTTEARCHDRPAEHEIAWHESWSEEVFAGGQYINPYTARFSDGTQSRVANEVRFGFTTRRVLREDGSWFDPKDARNVFVGPIRREGEPGEDIKGDFRVRSVNYSDPLVHHRRCGKAWVEQYRTAFYHFEHDHLLTQFPDGADEVFGQIGYGPRNEKTIVYEIVRSSSREHPHWKRQEM